MYWKNLNLWKKMFFGFGSILFLLILVGVWALAGIGNMSEKVQRSTTLNAISDEIQRREIDHLNWASQVAQLLTDDEITKLNVQTDPHKCAFGQWYDSEDRAKAEELIPELKPLLAEIKEHHDHLHASAIDIGKTFKQANAQLGSFLREKKVDHLAWAHKVKDTFIDSTIQTIDVETDPHRCELGMWMYSTETNQLKESDPTFAAALEELEIPHTRLHQSVVQIQRLIDEGKREEAAQFYMKNTKPTAYECLDRIDTILDWHDKQVQGMQEANLIYTKETKPALKKVQSILGQIASNAKNTALAEQEKMNSITTTTRITVMAVTILACLAGIVLAWMITRGIIGPLKQGVSIAAEVSDGNLTQIFKLDQKDEVGQLARALNHMSENLSHVVSNIQRVAEQVASSSEELSASSQSLASATTEQASSLEETSASIEELSSTIDQNASNSKHVNEIAQKSAVNAEQGGNAVLKTVDNMRKIAEQITIVDDIADQTNLLALNAAIEAARAGEMGKGFAVVAVEVRKLAERSQQAAREISDLAKISVEGADQAGKLIQEIIPDIKLTAQLVQDITVTCQEQSAGADQIRNALGTLDQVTQQNSATSEESAAASQELAAQAQSMQELISRFQIRNSKIDPTWIPKNSHTAIQEISYKPNAGKTNGKSRFNNRRNPVSVSCLDSEFTEF